MHRLLSRLASALSGPKPTAHSVASAEKDVLRDFQITKEDLLLAFRSTPIINRAIRFRADLIVARGFHIEYPDARSKEIIERFFRNIKLNSPQHLDFTAFLRNCCIDADWSGNAFLQLVPNREKTKIVKLHPLHPLYVDFQRDSYGAIKLNDQGEPIGFAYKPKLAGSYLEEINLKYDEVAHLVFETVGDELLGTPLILPLFRSIERLANIEWAIAKSLYKHGLPTRSISVGDRDHEPDADTIEKVAQEVQDIDSAAEYTHPYWYQVSTIDPKWPADVEKVPDYFIRLITAASGIPHYILLGEERIGTKATAESLQRSLSLMLDPMQARIKSFVENQIFRRVLDLEGCDSEVEFVWHEPIPDPSMPVADMVAKLASVTIEGKPVLSWKEARSLLELPIESHLSATFALNSYWGLPLVAPHAQLIWQGRKKAIVKSKRFYSHIGEPLYLLENQLCYGVISLDSPVEISLQEFRQLAPKHLVSEEEREEWWPDAKTLYYYPVMILQRFDPPRPCSYDPHAQVFVSEVKFS